MKINDSIQSRYLKVLVNKLENVKQEAEDASLDGGTLYQLQLVIVMMKDQIKDLKHGDDELTKNWLDVETSNR